MSKNGALVISLDFELLWGVFDVVDFEHKRNYFRNTISVIPRILELFEKLGVEATWATVGMLFNENWEEWNQNIPQFLPGYDNPQLSAYKFGKSIQNKNTEPLCFAPEVIQEIHKTPGQEIGTHTYSHYYCLEPGQDHESFEADLKMAVKLAAEKNIKLQSLVFPRNQIKEDFLNICIKMGIQNVRSNPTSWYWKNTMSNSLFTKIARTGDAYFSLGGKSYAADKFRVDQKKIIEQKASRFLRPVENNPGLIKLKLARIKSEMTIAAKKGEIYHLWWHPHNFGEKPEQSLLDLNYLMDHFVVLKEKYDFQSLSMKSLTQQLLKI